MNPKLILAGVLLLSYLGLIGYGYFEHNRFLKTKAEYSEFVTKSELNAAIATAEKERKEKEYANQILDAHRSRNIALAKLRQHQASAAERALSLASSSALVCYEGTELDVAYRILVTGLRAVSKEGDENTIELNQMIEAWPESGRF